MTRTRALIVAVLGFATIATALTACTAPNTNDPLIAISAPGEGNDVWGVGIAELTESLEKSGYRVEVQRAGDDVPKQNQQISDFIAEAPAVLVVAPVDPTSLGNRLDTANTAGVPVVVYDRVALDTVGVDFFVGFDHELAGKQQAWSLLAGLGLTDELGQPAPDAPAGPFAIELLAGDLNDDATEPMFEGAISVLQPYLAAGTLVIPSGITELEFASPTRGEVAEAAIRIREQLASGVHLDAILSPTDPMSLAVIAELPAPQATPTPNPTATATPTPNPTATPDPTPTSGPVAPERPTIVTGCGAYPDSIDAILAGTQFSTVGEDPRVLARAVADVVVGIARGVTPSATPVALDNGTEVPVPSLLVAPVLVNSAGAESAPRKGYCVRP